MTEGCSYYRNMNFVLNSRVFHCPICKKEGEYEPERGTTTGEGNHYKEVRVEFNFHIPNKEYRALAIVTDNICPGNKTYTLYSPLIKTERRALKFAEALLANLREYSNYPKDGETPRAEENVISMDADMNTFKRRLKEISSKWDT